MNTLSEYQQKFVDEVFPECREAMADYLARGVDVVIYRQHECSVDVPPFAVAPLEDTDFWIDCYESVDDALLEAKNLGLNVASVMGIKYEH